MTDCEAPKSTTPIVPDEQNRFGYSSGCFTPEVTDGRMLDTTTGSLTGAFWNLGFMDMRSCNLFFKPILNLVLP